MDIALNSHKDKKLNVRQGAAIVNGYGIGAGILAVPYLANRVGIWLSLLILILCYGLIYVLHLMIADLAIKTGKGSQMLDIFKKYIIKGKAKKFVSVLIFIFMFVVLTSNLCAYVTGAAEVLASNVPQVPLVAWKVIFYVFAGALALFGLKILGYAEQGATIAIFLSVGALIIGSILNIKNPLNLMPDSVHNVFSFFGIAMFAFSAFFCIPHVADGLQGDRKKIRQSIALGMLFNMTIIIFVMIFAVLASVGLNGEDVCTNAWAAGIGDWAKVVGCIFTVLAMFSTYWSVSFALRDVLKNSLNIDVRLCWLIATVPSLALSMIPFTHFTTFIDLASATTALLIGGFVIPAFHIARKENNNDNILGKFGCLATEIIIGIAMFAMVSGSVMNIINTITGT
mgnify:CR=1 FL=1